MIRFVEIERLYPLHHHLDLRFRIGNHQDVDAGALRNAASDQVCVPDLLQSRTSHDDGGKRRKLTYILHRVHVEVDLIGDSVPHMRLCPPSHTFDIQVVIDIHVVGGAVAATSAASERVGWQQVVVHSAHRSDGTGRVHDDSPGVHHFTELPYDFLIARKNHRRMSQPTGMIHVDAHPQRLINGFRSIHCENREQLLNRQRVFVPYP